MEQCVSWTDAPAVNLHLIDSRNGFWRGTALSHVRWLAWATIQFTRQRSGKVARLKGSDDIEKIQHPRMGPR